MTPTTVKLINRSDNVIPAYETLFSAGMDLRAYLPNSTTILRPMERMLVPTGLYIELPIGYEAQIRPRSGVAYKHGLTVLNAPGTIDADYRDEVKVLLVNLGEAAFSFNSGERIAQMVVAKHERVEWEVTDQLSGTARTGGFGSTGVK
jgi:dUTP pyrophosphatase